MYIKNIAKDLFFYTLVLKIIKYIITPFCRNAETKYFKYQSIIYVTYPVKEQAEKEDCVNFVKIFY